MRWSWRVARIRGIELRIHATFVLLVVWFAVLAYRDVGTLAGSARGVVFVVALFGCVVLHELGHAFAAQRFGVPTRDITLLPIGGVARLEHMPDQPRQELAIALAGPAVTALIVAVLWAVLRATGSAVIPTEEMLTRGIRAPLLAQLMWVNVSLFVFNLLPAFPMDGGRVLRALLAMRLPLVRATEVATRIGRGFAFLFGIVGLLYNPLLVLIAVFVWLGSATEFSSTQMRAVLGGVDVDQVMIRDIRTLHPTDTLDVALRYVLDDFQSDFPVVEDGRVVGVLTRQELLAGLANHGRDAPVSGSMTTSFRAAQSGEKVERVLAAMGETQCHTVPVLSGGQLRGVVTLDNIGEYVLIENALRARVSRAPKARTALSTRR